MKSKNKNIYKKKKKQCLNEDAHRIAAQRWSNNFKSKCKFQEIDKIWFSLGSVDIYAKENV